MVCCADKATLVVVDCFNSVKVQREVPRIGVRLKIFTKSTPSL